MNTNYESDDQEKGVNTPDNDVSGMSRDMAHANGDPMESVVAEQANMIRSVNWLGQHVPVCVLNRLGHEIGAMETEDDDDEHSIHRQPSMEGHLSDLSDDEEGSSDHLDYNTYELLSDSDQLRMLDALQEEEEENSRAEGGQIFENKNDGKQLTPKTSNGGGKCRQRAEISSVDSVSSLDMEALKPQATTENRTPQLSGSHNRKRLSAKLEHRRLPFASKHDCALLYVDISGFTQLSKLLDPESLSEAINSYFHLIVDEVTSFGGDILKFAGDALFAEWQATSGPSDNSTIDAIPHSIDPVNRMSLTECVAVAATCGAKIVSKCSDFPVFARKGQIGRTTQVATLNVHCGLGAGKVVGVHVGDSESRREYLVLGEPIKQSTEAANKAALGEFLASPEALAVMSKNCQVDEQLLSNNENNAVLIATKSSARFALRDPKIQRRCSVTHPWEGWEAESLQRYRKLISLYVHPVVVNNDLATSKSPRRSSNMREQHSAEAELRSVYVMFIHMNQVRARISGNTREDLKLFRLLNDIMEVTTRELNHFNGHLRQFIVDDKGLVLIATFGLRGSTFPSMVTERALPATISIHNTLQSELGVHNRIGATLGNAYCGLIGGMKRHEFAVLGPSVNLAARLMTNKSNPGILVDDVIRLSAGKSYGFNALNPVQAKGFAAPVPIFEPLSSLERGWGKIKHSFVGRKTEIMKLVSMAREIAASRKVPAKMVFVTGENGIGKSSMVIRATEYIRKITSGKRKRVVIAKHVCNESNRLVPFSMLRSILPDALEEVHAWQDDTSVASNSKMSIMSGMTWASVNESDADIQWEGLSVASSVSAGSGVYTSPERLLHVCREIDAPPEFIELVGHHLLGMDIANYTAEQPERVTGKPPSGQGTVNFVAQAFQMCTRRASLVVIALDDVQHMDEMSWKVLYKLFITSRNLLIICTSQLLQTHKLAVEDGFWRELNEKYMGQNRFIPMDLYSLGEEEMRIFLAREFGVKEDEISEQFLQDVFIQTGGMPHFAVEISQDLKRRNIVGMRSDNCFGWQHSNAGKNALASESIGELLVHRVDAFDPNVRNVLNLGAVLGDSFQLLDIIKVLQELEGATLSQEIPHAKSIIASLDLLVEEGILRQIFEGGEDSSYSDVSTRSSHVSDTPPRKGEISYMANVENRWYTFCHDLWRSSILKLMLDSRKKDIHRTIALTLESQRANDYEARVKLLGHWKASGDFSKAASLSLLIGKSFEELELHDQSVRLYEDTLEMWKGAKQMGGTSGGFSSHTLESVSVSDLENSIKLYTAMGHCLGHIHKARESVAAYQTALEILQASRVDGGIEDRSIAFPIFSGLFMALKCGAIEQDKDRSYEQELVRQFVTETRLNGDPVHYTRALAMQAEMNGRLGNFEKAFEAHRELTGVYNVDEHSADVCEAYGSDRSGQSFGASALWHEQQGNTEDAIASCRYVIEELMPKMELKNVHNSCMMLYPVLWVMKENGLAAVARDAFIAYVIEPFNDNFGEGVFTFYLPIFEPILVLFDLVVNEGSEKVPKFDEYVEWALDEENLRFGTVINNTTGHMGRCSDSISAEICLLLAKQLEEGSNKIVTLIRNGLAVARECVELAGSTGMVLALRQVKPVLEELERLSKHLHILDYT